MTWPKTHKSLFSNSCRQCHNVEGKPTRDVRHICLLAFPIKFWKSVSLSGSSLVPISDVMILDARTFLEKIRPRDILAHVPFHHNCVLSHKNGLWSAQLFCFYKNIIQNFNLNHVRFHFATQFICLFLNLRHKILHTATSKQKVTIE